MDPHYGCQRVRRLWRDYQRIGCVEVDINPIDPGLLAEATSPATSSERLAWLAANYPQLRGAIALNPNAYPELSAWIAAHPGAYPQGAYPPGAGSPGAGSPGATKTGLPIWAAASIVVVVVLSVVTGFAYFLLGRTAGGGGGAEGPGGATSSSSPSPSTGPVDVLVNQIDTSRFPEVTLYFEVLADDGVPVMTLQRSQFAVSEGSSGPLSFTSFLAPGDERNLAVSLVLDSSGSMQGQAIVETRSSATKFLDYVDLAGGDLVEVTQFDHESQVRLPYSSDRPLLEAAINTIEPDGGTAILDASYNALVRAYAQPGQKAVIVFTDGYDEDSTRSVSEVISLSEQVRIPVYIVGMGTDVDESMLRPLATQTGGEYYFSPTAADLEQIYRDVYDDEQRMYAATYVSGADVDAGAVDVTLSVEDKDYSGAAQTSFQPSVEEELPLELLYSSVTASSTLAPQNAADINAIMEYIPFHAFDGRNDTTWAEGSAGNGVGEWLQVDFARPTTVSGFEINNGYWRLPERIGQNGRVETMTVTFSDGSSELVTLYDTATAQWTDYYIVGGWNTEEIPYGESITFATPHTTSSMRFTVESVYPGSEWDDLCITSIVPFR